MAPKRKPVQNGFMTFTLEWKGKYGKGIRMREATAAAGKIWETMTAQERQPYNERAKQEKFSNRYVGEKLTCTGTPISQIESERLSHEDAERKMKRTIESMVRNSVRRDELSEQSYYFMMINYFIKTQKSVYVPAEIAVSEYSLNDGVIRKYHTFIDPDVTVYGHQYEAQQHSDSTHKLPLPPNAKGEKNLGRIYNDVLSFVQNKETGEYPPVFTERDSIIPVESVLEFLKADIGAKSASLNVYSIQYLFYILKEATCEAGEIEKPKSFYITDAYFECDNFEYETGIACQYHEDYDRTKYCPLSCVTRWGFMFSDYMCNDIAIPLIPGRHVPQKTNLAAVINPGVTSKQQSSTSHYGRYKDESKSCVSVKTENYASTVSDSRYYDDDQRSISVSDGTFRSMESRHHPPASSSRHSDERCYVRHHDDRFETHERSTRNPWATRSLRGTSRMPNDSHYSINPYDDYVDDDDRKAMTSSRTRDRDFSFYNNSRNHNRSMRERSNERR